MLSLALLVGTAAATPLTGTETHCLDGRRHTLQYSADVAGSSFVDLDSGDLNSKLSSVTCDVDHTNLVLNFHHRADAILYLAKFHDFKDHFIVGGKQWNCTSEVKTPMFILRRVLASSEGSHLGRDIHVRTSMARYDEVFETADISYGAVADATCAPKADYDKQICLGANDDCHGHVKKALPLYSGLRGQLTATCTDCRAALKSDLFLSLTIRGFKLSHLEIGLRNSTLDAHAVIDAHAANQTTLAIDKQLELVATTYLLDFKVGSVPFMLFFDVPLRVQAELQLSAAADVSFGVHGELGLGDLGLSWDPTNHWRPVTPSLTHALTPSLTTTAALNVGGTLAITPAFHVHFDRMFSYSITASPTLDATVQGSLASKQVCLHADYAMELVSTAELDINIDLLDFHKDWTWGPTTLGKWSGVPVPSKCVKI